MVTVIVRGASNPGNSAGTPTTTVRCTWHLPGVNGRPGAIIRKSDTVIGQPYTRVCRRGGRITSVRILIPRSELPGGQADLALPAPTLALSPRPDIGGVVGMDTWLAIAGVPQRQERWVSAGGLLALAGAVPTDTLTWTIAEIDPLTGQPMPESAEEDRVWMVECPVDAAQFGTADPQAVGCTHVFPRSGRYRIIASLTWNVALLSTDPAAPLQRLPDTLTVGSADLDVVELDTVITDMRGPRPLR